MNYILLFINLFVCIYEWIQYLVLFINFVYVVHLGVQWWPEWIVCTELLQCFACMQMVMAIVGEQDYRVRMSCFDSKIIVSWLSGDEHAQWSYYIYASSQAFHNNIQVFSSSLFGWNYEFCSLVRSVETNKKIIGRSIIIELKTDE